MPYCLHGDKKEEQQEVSAEAQSEQQEKDEPLLAGLRADPGKKPGSKGSCKPKK